MKIRFVLVVTIILNLSLLGESHADESKNKSGSLRVQREAVLNYLRQLTANPQKGVLSGQWYNGPEWPEAYSLFVEKLHEKTGKWVAIMGSMYSASTYGNQTPRAAPPQINSNEANQLTQEFITQWQNGGFVYVSFLPDNPWYRLGHGRSCSANPSPCAVGSMNELTKTDNAAGLYFRAELDQVATYLEELRKAKVVVLFRPLNEMNGSWFWWGAQSEKTPSQAEFTALWIYIHDYLSITKGLNNLLWVFAPANSESVLRVFPNNKGLLQPAPYYYPGGHYVDITGVSYYENQLEPVPGSTEYASKTSIPTYEKMLALGKPFGFAELGPESKSERSFDFDKIIHNARKYYPKVIFFNAWQDHDDRKEFFSIVANKDPNKLMNDPLVITRERVKLPFESSNE